jgi:hypothetical protein
MELEELRKRLLVRSGAPEIPLIRPARQFTEAAAGEEGTENEQSVKDTVDNTSNGAAAAVSAAGVKSPPSLAAIVGELFEPTDAFRSHFIQLSSVLRNIDTAGLPTQEALARIADFYERLASLANAFQSVKVFADQVKQLSTTFEPMKGLHEQLSQLIQAFYGNVKELGVAFEPVKVFQAKVRQLAQTLELIDQLEVRLLNLAEAFRPSPKVSEGMDNRASASR